MPPLRLALATLAALAVAAASAADTPTPTPPPSLSLPRLGRFDPCAPPGAAAKGRGFYLGVAFWPGGTPADWGPATGVGAGPDAPGAAVLPCRLLPASPAGTNGTGKGDRPLLATKAGGGGGYAAFQVRVDTVAALTFNASEVRKRRAGRRTR